MNKIKFKHINLISRDWKKLAGFYIKVFGLEPVHPERELKGQWLEDITGVKDAEISGIHMKLPGYGYNSPTLEIFEYSEKISRSQLPAANQPGFGHISFHVYSVKEVLEKLIKNGGKQFGEIITKEYPEIGLLTAVYTTDPEGNFIEIQNWQKKQN